MDKKKVIALCAACLVAGYLVSVVPGFSPVNPFAPQSDRPVLALLRRLAKVGLWVAVFAEPQPKTPYKYDARRYGHDQNICHAEGW